jgi:multidrug resistance efflux pump
VILYNHPSTTNVTLFSGRSPIIPEANGRVAEVYINGVTGPIAKGEPIFRLDSSKQEASAEMARRKIAEVEAEMVLARIDIEKADGQLQEARSSHRQAVDELETKRELQSRNPVASRCDLSKTVVRAGVSGQVEQFTLRVGNILNPFVRTAGILYCQRLFQQS